jgi:hypothetical protein
MVLVLRQGMQLVALGVALGITVSLLVGRALSTLLFGVSPLSRVDPLVGLRDA